MNKQNRFKRNIERKGKMNLYMVEYLTNTKYTTQVFAENENEAKYEAAKLFNEQIIDYEFVDVFLENTLEDVDYQKIDVNDEMWFEDTSHNVGKEEKDRCYCDQCGDEACEKYTDERENLEKIINCGFMGIGDLEVVCLERG